MFKKLKLVVFFLKLLTNLVLLRSFGNIIYDVAHKYNEQMSVPQLRKLEKLYIKSHKAKLDIIFLKNCKTFGVFPKFISFNLPYTNKTDTNAIRRRLLKTSITKRIKEKNKLEKELNEKIKEVRTILNGVEWYMLYKAIKRNVDKSAEDIILTHEKKLQNLTKNHTIPFHHDDVVTNLSNTKLTQPELDLLNNGLSFSIPPKYIKKSDVFTQFEMINRFMKQELKGDEFKMEVKNELSHMANCYENNYKPTEICLR